MLLATVILVHMIGDGFDIVVNVPVKMSAALTMVTPALDHVPKVRDDTGGDEGLAAVIKIQPPRIARAPSEDLELVLGGMITPHAGVDLLALLVRRSGLANIAVGENAVAAIEPAIRPPSEAV